MADQKITNLTEDTSPLETDLVMTVDDPGGTPINKKVTISALTRFKASITDALMKVLFTAKGSMIVASAAGTPAELLVGDEGDVPTAQADGSVAWEPPAAGGGTGDVTGPAASGIGHLAVFADETGKVIEDGGAPAGGGDVHGSDTVTNEHMAVFDVDGYHLKDGGAPGAGGSSAEVDALILGVY